MVMTLSSYMMQLKVHTYSIVMKLRIKVWWWIKIVKDMLAEKADMKKVDRQQLLHEACVLLRDYQNLSVDYKWLLFRKISPKNQIQLVLPLKFKPLVYSELHVKMGHLGIDWSMQLIKDRFYWPGMGSDISHFITRACFFVKKKRPSKLEKTPLQSISTMHPWNLLA